MHPDFWHARWREGRIGFHEGKPNDHLVEFADHLGLASARVLVPLCGKTADLAWLAARAKEVVGVELVPSAVEAFFAERELVAERRAVGELTAFTAANLTIFAGDFFALAPDVAGKFDVCFDRAALVALPPALRERYIAHCRALHVPDTRTLLVTFDHDGPTTEPPFSVPTDVVRTLFAGEKIAELTSRDVFDAAGPHASRGATRAREHVFLIERA